MQCLSHFTADANKSRAEISAVNNLRRLYDALLADKDGQEPARASSPVRDGLVKTRPQSARVDGRPGSTPSRDRSSVVDAIRSLRRQHHELKNPTKSPSTHNYVRKTTASDNSTASTVFTNWVTLVTTVAALENDLAELKREIKASESKCADLQLHARLRIESSDLDPKLQCLEEIIGAHDFKRYLDDLNRETATFRQRLGLYSRRFRCFQQKIWETHERRVAKETCLTILNNAVALSDGSEQTTEEDDNSSAQVVLLSQYPMLVQYCLDPQNPDRIVLSELLQLISALPMGREKLVRHLFEQISDVRRGEGSKPPPDAVRPHKLMALVKQSHADGLCSKDELEEIVSWLASPHEGENNANGVSLTSFLNFHIQKSDAFCAEDAEFVTYLMRMWRFTPRKDDDAFSAETSTESISQVLKSYEIRCQQLAASSRKKELVLKIQNTLANHLTKRHALEPQVQDLRVLRLDGNPAICQSIQRDAKLAAQVTHSLSLLQALVLSGQCLDRFPAFISSLSQLEALDLSDNRLSSLPPEIEHLQCLQRLVLSENRFTDSSFHDLEVNLAKLSALCELQLNHNQLTTLPRAIPALSRLQVLNLSNNLLRSLPRSVVQLWEGKCQLVVLDLRHNDLRSLPEEMAVMGSSLRRLSLHGNKLEKLPAAISQLHVLEELSLSKNALGSNFQVYPVTLEQKHINLDHNQLRVLPSMHSVAKMYLEGTSSKISSVSASWNRLRSIPPDALPSLLPNCLELNLDHNSLHDLPEELFHALPLLRVCNLGTNQLRKLPSSIAGCKSLQVLDLQQNRIEALPSDLADLMHLVVLNATENQLSSIPSEWHAFASHCDAATGRRVLQTLGLRKNPVQNKVLKTIIDGGSVDIAAAAVATTKPNDEQNCEFVVKKLIDALRDTIDVLAMESEGFDEPNGEEAVGYGERHSTRKWKGMTRNVNKYLESRLASIRNVGALKQHSQSSKSGYLHVDGRAFNRMIKSLPFTCSESEMASLLHQFRVKRDSRTDLQAPGETIIDGFDFLRAIDQFGQHRTLSRAPPPANSSFSISKPGDPIAPVLHYLSIIHCQQQRELQRSPKKKKERRVKPHAKEIRSGKEGDKVGATTRGAPQATEEQKKQTEARENQATLQFLQRHLDPEQEVVMKRQKQRIQILEQQLMDQKLLRLSQDQRVEWQKLKASGLRAPTWMSDDEEEGASEDDKEAEREDHEDASGMAASVLVCVKCMKGQEKLLAMRKWKHGPIRFPMRVEATILEVKQQIEQKARVPIDKQVLIATKVHGGRGLSIRLRNDAVITEYLEKLESKMRWHVTLLVGESLLKTKTVANS